MNKNFSLEQISKTGNLDANLISRQYTLDLLARFMEIISVNPRLIQDQITKEIGCPISTLQRYRNDINMLSPITIPPSKTNEKKQKISNHENDLKRLQLTSKESSPNIEVVKPNTSKKNK